MARPPVKDVEAAHAAAVRESTVESISATIRDVKDMAADPRVLGFARAMPVELVRPIGDWEPQSISGTFCTWGIEAIGASLSSVSGKGICVAVLDTGIDENHPAFRGMTLVRQDFTGEGLHDDVGHGTHCAGTIFGKSVDGVSIGVAPGVERALVGKVIGTSGSTTQMLYKGILWALGEGAHVVSLSLSFDFTALVQQLVATGTPLELATSEALDAYYKNVSLFTKLATLAKGPNRPGQGAIIVAAAGNNSKRTVRPDYELFVTAPAAAEGVISVGAVERSESGLHVASFSNTGPTLCAPGVDIVSAKAGGGLASNTGTSMAAPHVAGVAALWSELLRNTYGAVLPDLLSAKLIGSATVDNICLGYDAMDVGAGVVRSPASPRH